MASQAIRLERDEHTGRRLGRYEILCRMATGGMSDIYLGFQRSYGGFGKPLVLKCIRRSEDMSPGLVQMFLDEGRITAGFNHPNIAQVLDLGEEKQLFYIAMEYLPGATLHELVRAVNARGQRLPIGFTVAAVRDTAMALSYAHLFADPSGTPLPIIHRDVTSKNIIVTFDGVTKLLDFGVAKVLANQDATRVKGVKGTTGYMSPEQIRSERLDARTDVFGLGVVLYEALTGTRPFRAKDWVEELELTLTRVPAPPSSVNPDVTPELDQVVATAMEKDPANRYPSAMDLAQALDRAGRMETWDTQQRGELVHEHFGQRREQAHRLFAATIGTEESDSAALAPFPVQVEEETPGNDGAREGIFDELDLGDLALPLPPSPPKKPVAPKAPTAAEAPKPPSIAAPAPSPRSATRRNAILLVATALMLLLGIGVAVATSGPVPPPPVVAEPPPTAPTALSPAPPPPAPAPVPPQPRPLTKKSALILDTNPKAEVSINREPAGSTPLHINLVPGSYDLTLKGPDNVVRGMKVDISATANTVLLLPLSQIPRRAQ